MKPRRTHTSTNVYHLVGGTEDNDLWVRKESVEGTEVIESVWELSQDERDLIARGFNINLRVYGGGQPPVLVELTDVPLGKRHAGGS